ncbi:MAG: hypothetical protein KAQ89_02045 [Planctomycetes bacterium]|nr:hypothetical protein [Planctomycetota bacterium]
MKTLQSKKLEANNKHLEVFVMEKDFVIHVMKKDFVARLGNEKKESVTK